MPPEKKRPASNVLSPQTAIKICQQEMVKYDLRVKAFIQDIRECLGPREVLNTLNLRVGENLKKFKESIDELERIAMELDKNEDKQPFLNEVETNRKQLANNVVSLRKANLSSHSVINQKTREELFSSSPSEVRKRPKAGKESLVQTTSSITDNLLTISRQLANQVQQSEKTLEALAGSSGVLEETNEEYKNMGSVISQSKQLLTKYGRRECTDRVLIIVAFLFFLFSVLYVIRDRLF